MTRKRATELLVIAGLFVLACSFAEGRSFLLFGAGVVGLVVLLTLFLLVCRAPFIVLHECGHALTAWMLGWHVRAIVIGLGPLVGRFQLARTSIEIRWWPICGFVQPEPASLRWTRTKSILILLAGSIFELAALALLLWALDETRVLTPQHDGRLTAAALLSFAILYDVLVSLFPWKFRTAEGTFENDGGLILGVLRSPRLALPSKSLAELAAESAYKPEAFDFVRDGIYRAAVPSQNTGMPMHAHGTNLCRVLRELAIANFGVAARQTLAGWGIKSNRDIGQIVFAMVEGGWMQKTEEDSLDDFDENEVFADVNAPVEEPGTIAS